MTSLLAACGSSNTSDLQIYFEEVKAKPKGQLEPIPVFEPYEAFNYASSDMRSPFVAPIMIDTTIAVVVSGKKVKPDLDRTKEHLEQFNLGDLTMVGTLELGGEGLWALIADGDGGVYRVKKGYFIGKNHGQVVEVQPSSVSVMEIASDGNDGWLERPRTLIIKEH
jgi:type IV pilus assembly protein PilP